MQDIKRDESWEIEDQMQTSEYILRFEPLLYIPVFTQKDFHYVHIGPSTKGPPPENYNNTSLKYTTPTLTPLHKRDHKVKKELQSWWSNDHKPHLVISKDHKQFSHKNKDPKDRSRDDSSSVRKIKCLEKRTIKKNTWEKYKIDI